MKQVDVFLEGEGNKYHERNRHKELNPRVLDAISALSIKPNYIMEIGCGDGRYLNELRGRFRPRSCVGLDPSSEAITEGREKYPDINFIKTDARYLYAYEDAIIDLLVFGFCLYLVDRDDLFSVVHAVDKALRPGGYLAIHDFGVWVPHIVPYKHKDGLYSYKMDYPGLWLANPAYVQISKTITGPGTEITILQKKGWERFK